MEKSKDVWEGRDKYPVIEFAFILENEEIRRRENESFWDFRKRQFSAIWTSTREEYKTQAFELLLCLNQKYWGISERVKFNILLSMEPTGENISDFLNMFPMDPIIIRETSGQYFPDLHFERPERFNTKPL